MKIGEHSFLAEPVGRLVRLVSPGSEERLGKVSFEAEITYLKGIRDGMAESATAVYHGAPLDKPAVETLVTYLKGVRDGRGWNDSL